MDLSLCVCPKVDPCKDSMTFLEAELEDSRNGEDSPQEGEREHSGQSSMKPI